MIQPSPSNPQPQPMPDASSDLAALPPSPGVLSELLRFDGPGKVGLILSMFIHMLLGLGAAAVYLGAIPDGEGSLGDAPIMVLPGTDAPGFLTSAPVGELSADSPAVALLGGEPAFQIQDLNSPFFDNSGEGEALSGLQALSGAGTTGSGAGGEGVGPGLGGAGGEARFFGLEARGSRFAFVIDVSGSMLPPEKIGALQAALIESIDGLLDNASFCVVLYSSGAVALLGDEWARATDEKKKAADRGIRSIQPTGGTNPLPAFDIAFSLKPAPDAIYFMTDGVFSNEVAQELPAVIERKMRENEHRTPIHCITFQDDGSAKLMRRLARVTGGSYVHVASQAAPARPGGGGSRP